MFASVSSFAVRLAGMEALVKDSQGQRLLEIADSIPPLSIVYPTHQIYTLSGIALFLGLGFHKHTLNAMHMQ